MREGEAIDMWYWFPPSESGDIFIFDLLRIVLFIYLIENKYNLLTCNYVI